MHSSWICLATQAGEGPPLARGRGGVNASWMVAVESEKIGGKDLDTPTCTIHDKIGPNIGPNGSDFDHRKICFDHFRV